MPARALSTDGLAWRLAMQSHLVFLALALAALGAAVEAAATGGPLGGWRVAFLPVTVLQTATRFLAYAWFAVLVGQTLIALAPDAPGRAGRLAGWMERNSGAFFWYLLALALAKAAGALVNLWSLGPAAPLQTLNGSLAAAWPELLYAAALGLLARALAVARAREAAP